MTIKREAPREIDSLVLTYGNLAKVIGAAVLLIGWTLGVYGWVASLDKKIDMLRVEQSMSSAQIREQIAGLETGRAESVKAINDLTRMVDRATGALDQLLSQSEKHASTGRPAPGL